MKKRPDPSMDGEMRLSLPYEELCRCKRVVTVADKTIYSAACRQRKNSTSDSTTQLWFVDSPEELTNMVNWNRESMDRLLNRDRFCNCKF